MTDRKKMDVQTLLDAAEHAASLPRRPRPYRGCHRRLEVYHGSWDEGAPEKAVFVDPLRAYAEATIEAVSIPVDFQHANDLLSREGAIDPAAVAARSEFRMEPVLIAEHFFGRGRHEMVDGNHTYVAFALALSAIIKEVEFPPDFEPGVPAIFIPRDVWRDFRAVRGPGGFIPLDGRRIARRLKRVEHDLPFDFSCAGAPRPRRRKRGQ